MSKQKFYICAGLYNSTHAHKVLTVQYGRKADLIIILNIFKQHNILAWIDFVWQCDIDNGKQFHVLHGKGVIETKNILEAAGF